MENAQASIRSQWNRKAFVSMALCSISILLLIGMNLAFAMIIPLSFIISLIGCIFAIMAIKKIKVSHEKGLGMAIIALILNSMIMLFTGFFVFILFFVISRDMV